MRPVLALGETTAELVDALGTDDTTLLYAEKFGDFLPCPASLTLFADEIHKRFEPTVKGSSAARAFSLHRQGVIHGFQFHQPTAYDAPCLPR
jgi:hypothetical protein